MIPTRPLAISVQRESIIRLRPDAFQAVWNELGPFTIDLMASTASSQGIAQSARALPLFSQYDCAGSSGVDALAQDVLRAPGTVEPRLDLCPPYHPRRFRCMSCAVVRARKVEADIAPFQALLLGMFFMTVGFEIDLVLCFNNMPLVASLVSAGYVLRLGFLETFVVLSIVIIVVDVFVALVVAFVVVIVIIVVVVVTGILIPLSAES